MKRIVSLLFSIQLLLLAACAPGPVEARQNPAPTRTQQNSPATASAVKSQVEQTAESITTTPVVTASAVITQSAITAESVVPTPVVTASAVITQSEITAESVVPTPVVTASAVKSQVEQTAESITTTPVVTASAVKSQVEQTAESITTTPVGSASAVNTPWQDLPVIPTLSPRALEIYRAGLTLGNNPRAFSKIGDCESAPDWFLSDFDKGPRYYDLGPHTGLAPVIDYFAGSYRRISLAVKPGFTATSVLTPLWADPKQCAKDESPLACEYRLHRPAFAIIMLGSNNTPRPERFEPQMRKILDQTIARGIVPILVTKADNLEGGHQINQAIARLAAEYDLPLWNYWRAVQPLPHHGLQEDGAHLTWGPNQFADPEAMQTAWAVRNLTALQLLGALMKAVPADNR